MPSDLADLALTPTEHRLCFELSEDGSPEVALWWAVQLFKLKRKRASELQRAPANASP